MDFHDPKNFCFVILPGFAPDNVPVLPIAHSLQEKGYHATPLNFWGDFEVKDFSKLTLEQCKFGIAEVIAKAVIENKHVIGIGISLGGALLIEHAKMHSNLTAIVSIGTPFELKNKWFWKTARALYPLLEFFWSIGQIMKIPRMLPVPASKMAVDYLEGSFLKNFESVKTPVLFLHSTKDMIANPMAIESFSDQFYNTFISKVYLHDTNHTIEYSGNIILKQIKVFLEEIPSLTQI